MCKRGSKIHLCSCSDLEGKDVFFHENMNVKLSIKWTLYQFVKEEWTGIDGMLFSPVNAFSTSLTADFFRDEMNIRNCFDFEYHPNEGDNIIFRLITYDKRKHKDTSERKFISLIFRNKVWSVDYYDTFYTTTEEIKTGFLKLNP